MYRSILVPLDGSPFGEHALPFALSLARRTGAQIHLAHVHVAHARILAEADDAKMRAAERAYLERLVQRLKTRWDVPITLTLLDGPVVQALHEYAVASDANLIVMTTHGRGALARFWLGNIADTLIRQVPVPVLLIRPQEQPLDFEREPTINHILIPLDGSLLAEQMLTHATALGRLRQAEYTLLQVIEPVYVGYGTELYGVGADDQAIEQLRAQAQGYVDRVAAGLRANGLRVQTATVIDQAATAVLSYAHEHAVDLVALTTHGRSGFARLLMGGVADKIIRGATVPVLLYRPQGAGKSTQ